MGMDVVATTEDVANLHLLCLKSTIKPAPAVSTGGVSGGANVTVTAAVEVPESALLYSIYSCRYAEEDNVVWGLQYSCTDVNRCHLIVLLQPTQAAVSG